MDLKHFTDNGGKILIGKKVVKYYEVDMDIVIEESYDSEYDYYDENDSFEYSMGIEDETCYVVEWQDEETDDMETIEEAIEYIKNIRD